MIDSIFDKAVEILVFQEILYTNKQVNKDIQDNIIQESNVCMMTYFITDEQRMSTLDINAIQLYILNKMKDKLISIKIMDDFINYINLKEESVKLVLNHDNHVINENELILYKFSGNISTEKNLIFNDYHQINITINICVINYWKFLEVYNKYIK